MSTSETITRTDLTNILNEVLPISYSLSSVKTVTLPFTPTSNGLLIGLIRTTAQGRAYVSLNNTTPNLMDGFNVTEGYYCATVFAEKGKQISVASTYNVKQHLYYFVSLGNDSLTDYIVEQGASGIWTYRKWNSGIAECWGTSTFTSVPMTNAWGYGYYASSVGRTINLPSGLFTAVNAVEVGVDFYGGTGNWNLDGRSTSQLNGYLWSTKSETRSKIDVFTTVKGKWK